MSPRAAPLATFALVAIVAAMGARPSAAVSSPSSRAAERAYARTVTPLTADAVTANLRGVVGKRVAFVCAIVTVVDRRTIIGQCGKDIEPVDLYVHTPTARLHIGERLRILGEMETPSMWVDVSGHPWYTGFVNAKFADRF